MVVRIKNDIFPSNSYVIYREGSNNCLLIDPGLDFEGVDRELQKLKLAPSNIISTHGHFDHVSGATFFKKKYKAKFHIHQEDLKILKSVNFVLKMMKFDLSIETPVPDNLITGYSTLLKLDSFFLNVYNFPGHTNGSCLVEWENNLFTGDTLYKTGLGLNSFPGENKKDLRISLAKILHIFNDQVMVYPGHGDQDSLGKIKIGNSELKTFLND
jgi:Zn-dependent hydrolases, including glyoxylases